MADSRPRTPPPSAPDAASKKTFTPEQIRRQEELRLKSKALRVQQERESRNASLASAAASAGQKRSRPVYPPAERTVRDARQEGGSGASVEPASKRRPHEEILQPARNMGKYIEYDFSKIVDTKGGFLTQDDDPNNRALYTPNQEDKPAHMTLKEWERHQLLKKLREQKAGPFEPSISSLNKDGASGKCRECGSLEIDWLWVDTLQCSVCNACKEKFPEKYSLLTKSEVKQDYLLTDPELRDPDLLPRLEKPNPHKATWHNMMLYLRYQVEEYALSDKKWSSAEAMDAEFAKRELDKKKRKEAKFREKLDELKKRTRVDAYKRSRAGGGGNFGDSIVGRIGQKHQHEWGRPVTNADGDSVKQCVECGMEVEELEL